MAGTRSLTGRLKNKWRRFAVGHYGRRDFQLTSDVPYISFTFDDFPRSSLVEGGRILMQRGVRGTYFVSMQLLGTEGVSGPIASDVDLRSLLNDGHELGCHTFEHLDGTKSDAAAFERSIEANRAALVQRIPGEKFSVFAYPLNGPVLSVKRAVGRHFVGCRGGGQTHNGRSIDLNLLQGYFLDKKNRGDLDRIRRAIEETVAARGWLIFATHDVAAYPSDYGCDPGYFEEVVRLSIQSGARVLPMAKACEALGIVSPLIKRNIL